MVQRSALGPSREPLDEVPESVRETVARPGRSLHPGVRQKMEGHFGANFSNVKIHTDAAAASSAANINAAAYAIGNSVVFNNGYYQPESRMGQGLLAHELTHVLQQSRGAGHSEFTGPTHEREADRAAEALDGSAGPFRVSGRAAVGIGPLTFGELQKKVWAHVPESAKPYLRPLAQEAKEQVEKVITPDAQIPPAVAAVIEHPIESAKKVAVKAGHKAKEELRDYAMDKAGTLKGVVMEGTSIVDTLIWAGYESGKNYGLVGSKTEAPTISEKVAGGIDKAVEKGEKTVFGDLPPEQALVFNSYEAGELKGAIGSQIALGFVGVEEVQLALKAVGVLGSLRGLMLLLQKQGTAGWYKNPEFVGALVGVALSFLSLKSTKAANKIINMVLASGSLISAGPAVWKLSNDWKNIPESDPKREKILKDDLGALVKLIANIAVDIVRHQSSKRGPGEKVQAPTAGDELIAPATKPAPSEAAAASSPQVEQPVVRPVAESPVVKPAPATAVSEPIALPASTKPAAAKPASPVDVGLADRGVRPQPGTRNESKASWKARDSAQRRARRIDEAMARIDAEAKRAPVDTAEPSAKPGASAEAHAAEPKSKPGALTEAKAGSSAERPIDSTRVTKQEATAVEPTVNGHEAVVNKRGVGVCSPSPCPLIHVAYRDELANAPNLKAWNDRIQAMRHSDPHAAAIEAAALIRTLEAQRNNAKRSAGMPRDDVDVAFDAAQSAAVSKKGGRNYLEAATETGSARKRVPREAKPKVDLEDLVPNAAEAKLKHPQRAAAARTRTVVGRTIADHPKLKALWDAAAAKTLAGGSLTKSNYKEMYNKTRDEFWIKVRADKQAQATFAHAGLEFGDSGKAPLLRVKDPTNMPVEERRVSLDHNVEKGHGDGWQLALDPANLIFEMQMPNSTREIKQARHPELRPPQATQ